ncbi:hypothetical protein BDV96DRAFT_693209 [Lophiotrema nucula]|uniref:F-box domain-containing protein n=1 Tax=Lophiotrema nucula TaxID=690887 RepID=A0A6A5YN12_9PLEO|nr:hypothetical protein BDV96DRAFT_693209 [Lophiotrema nucula]
MFALRAVRSIFAGLVPTDTLGVEASPAQKPTGTDADPHAAHPLRLARKRSLHARSRRTRNTRFPNGWKTTGKGRKYALMPTQEELWEEEVDFDCNSFRKFLELPRELRDAIYEYAMDDLPTRFTLWKGIKIQKMVLYPATLPGVCFVNRQTRIEACLAYIRRTRFTLVGEAYPSQHRLIKWLEQFEDDKGFAAVRRLCYEQVVYQYSDCRYPFSSASLPFGLVRRCTGLHDLILTVSAHSVVHQGNPHNRLLTTTEIENEMGFERLFENKSIKKVKIYCVEGHTYKENRASAEEVFANFSTMVRGGFKSYDNSAKLELVVTSREYGDNCVVM